MITENERVCFLFGEVFLVGWILNLQITLERTENTFSIRILLLRVLHQCWTAPIGNPHTSTKGFRSYLMKNWSRYLWEREKKKEFDLDISLYICVYICLCTCEGLKMRLTWEEIKI